MARSITVNDDGTVTVFDGEGLPWTWSAMMVDEARRAAKTCRESRRLIGINECDCTCCRIDAALKEHEREMR